MVRRVGRPRKLTAGSGGRTFAASVMGNFGTDLWSGVSHPLDTLENAYGNVKNTVLGAITPTKPDLSMSVAANQRAQGATQDFANQRAAYAPMNAPQIAPATAPPPTVNHAASVATMAHGGGEIVNNPSPAGAYDGLTGNQGRQQGALDLLQGAAMGTAPSAAQIQSNQQLGTAMANQYALASGLQGRHPGAAFDAASRGAAAVQGNVIGQGAVQRAGEQAQARDAYASATGGARGQDIQTDVANLNAKLTTMGYDEQTRNALLAAQLQAQGYDVSTANAIISAQTATADSANKYKGNLWSGAGNFVTALL